MRVALFCIFGLVGCDSGKRYTEGGSGSDGLESDGDDAGESDDGDGPDGPDDDDDGPGIGDDDDDDDADGRDAVVLGRVWVELYTEDEDGDRAPLSWETAMGTDPQFPFGSIFVAAFDEAEEEKTYFAQDTILRPSIGGDTYVLSVDPSETDHANVYATLDIRGDGILGSGEPIGVYGDDIQIRRGTEADDVDIAIMVNWAIWGPGGSGWGGGGGGGGGGGSGGGGGGSGGGGGDYCGSVDLSGDVNITVPYGGGNGMAMLLDLEGYGPYLSAPFTPVVTPEGAVADFQLQPPCHVGAYQLVGAYDSNGNSLIDPMDEWGTFVDTPGVNGNPVTIADEALPNHDIEIPLEEGSSLLAVVPFIRLSGTLFPFDGGTLEEQFGEDAKIYVVALKYPAEVDMPVALFDEEAYDVDVYKVSDYLGEESLDWEVLVPANINVYLWGFVDVDDDRAVNEVEEPVACGGTGSSCKLPVGEDAHEGLTLGLRVAG